MPTTRDLGTLGSQLLPQFVDLPKAGKVEIHIAVPLLGLTLKVDAALVRPGAQ